MAANRNTLARTCLLGGSLLLAASGCAVVHHGPQNCGPRNCDDYCGEGQPLFDDECRIAPDCHPLDALLTPFHWLGLPGGGFEAPQQPVGVSPQPRLFPVPTHPVFGPNCPVPDESAGRPRSPSSPRTANRLRNEGKNERELSDSKPPKDLAVHQASFTSASSTTRPAETKPDQLSPETTKSAVPISASSKDSPSKQTLVKEVPKSTLVMRIVENQPPALPENRPATQAAMAETSAADAAQPADSTWRPIIRQR